MKEAASLLNLKSHLCGLTTPVELAAAADIEGHLGTDNRYYLLDFSRTMPPVRPEVTRFRNSHLFYLFRREFVKNFQKPLCSDGYSGFILKDPMMRQHNKEIDEATEHLHATVIPSCSRELCQV